MAATGVTAAGTAAKTKPEGDASASPIKLDVERHARTGETVKFTGKAPANARVAVEVDGKQIETTQAGDTGKFRVQWSSGNSGVYRVKASVVDAAATAASSHPERVNVYRSAAASYYGPGLYGNSTACGGRLTPKTVGVAHKTLPCGTKVTLRYRGRTVTVPVIDRGPYAGNREYDLTAATKAKLGFGSTGNVLTTR
jgi:rare lipoprotein A (peptidoglycan hydrolase)